MNVKLYNHIDENISPRVQVCLNRGIPIEETKDFLDGGTANINAPTAFDETLLKAGARKLIECISSQSYAYIVVDSDCDGFTSAAILINYLYSTFPSWVQNNLFYGFHEGKQHGLVDKLNEIYDIIPPWGEYNLVICPDSASNDLPQIEDLYGNNIEVLILDHHITEEFSSYAVTINSQYNYPNPQLSGAGVVYQFCRYLDSLLGQNLANNFLDLVAIGLQGDMMSLQALETKELIFEGLKEENLKNPLIYGISQKNAFALGKADYIPSNNNQLAITPIGSSFFIIPLINAICRSGTMEEKQLIFESMLTLHAFDIIPSNKRGHKLGETERRVDQALRTLTNVKNRQTRNEEAGLEFLESKIPDIIDNKVFVFINDGSIDKNIAGLVANKMMAKYQRPVCVISPLEDGTYAGSMRGYTKTGITSFKDIAESSSACSWIRGHENAAGICITDPDTFVQDMNNKLIHTSTEITYYVDYIFNASYIKPDIILTLADMNDYIGQDFERPYVYIKEIELDSLQIMKSNTIKLSTPSGVDLMMFGASDEEIEKLSTYKGEMNAICKCVKNEWNGNCRPQLIITDYELFQPSGIKAWGF